MKKLLLILMSISIIVVFVACNQSTTIDDVYEAQSYGSFKVGKTLYLTLEDAVKAISSWGGVKGNNPIIYLLKDVTDSGAVIDSNVVLDFGSYTYTLSGSKTGIEIKEGCSVEISGGIFKSGENDDSLESFFNSNGNLVVSNTTIELSNTTLNAIETKKGKTDISGKVLIVVADESNILVAGGSSEVRVKDDSEVFLKGSFDLSGEAKIDLADSDLTLTRKIVTDGGSSSIELADMTGVGEVPVFRTQPDYLYFSPNGEGLDLTCIVDNNPYVGYQWYTSEDGTVETGRPIEKAIDSTYLIPDYSKTGIYYYYCEAKDLWVGETDVAVSNVVSVAYTGLPLVSIDTDDKENPTSEKEKHTGKMIISYPDGSCYISEQDGSFSIKARGNYTVNYPKLPYKLKINKKKNLINILSDKDLDKNWVLLANYCDKTLLRTSIGFYVSSLFNNIDGNQSLYVPNSSFVDVVLNGEYIGNYNLVDSIKEGKNRLNVNEKDSDKDGIGFIAEYDGYYRSEPKWFISSMNFPYTFKYPDTDDSSFDDYMASFKLYINDFEKALCDEETSEWENYIDVESFARFFLITNIIGNKDGNCFLSKRTTGSDSKLIMGPAWDFEWSIGIGWYDGERPESPDYWCLNGWYYQLLLTKTSFVNEVKRQWELLNKAYPDLAGTITSKMDEYATDIYYSQIINFIKWDIMDKKISVGGIPLGSYNAELECDKQFIQSRIQWLNGQIQVM